MRLRAGIRAARVGPALFALLIVISAFPFHVTPGSASPPSERTGWMAGMGFLLGTANTETSTDFSTGWVSGVTPQWRFGHSVIDNRLMLSVENKQWTRERGSLPDEPPPYFVKYQVGVQVFGLNATVFPGNAEDLWGGFYVNAGVGPAVARFDSALVDTLGSGEDPPEVVFYEWGWGYFIGGGYEYRFLDYVAAGMSLNYQYASIKQDFVDNSRIWALAFTLNWYFK